MENWDVVIVGAGPAGLAVARQLAGSKLKVLLLDRALILGSKPCGGGICEKEKPVEYENAWVKMIGEQDLVLNGKKRLEIKHQYKRITFEREDLASYWEKMVTGSENIKIMKGVMVEKIEKDRVITNKGVFGFGYLVGADGTSSIVRKYLRLEVRVCLGLYYKVWGEYEKFVSAFEPKIMKMGYIWEFPHKKYNNIGIYFDPRYLKAAEARKSLEEYLNARGYKWEGKDFCAAPINYYYAGYQFGNIFLVGDAGGFASRQHGGGMNNAIVSGTDVGKKILDPGYQTKGIEALVKSKQEQDRVLDILESLPPGVLNLVLTIGMNLFRIPFFQRVLPL